MHIDNINLFEAAFSNLDGKTHGDTLAIYLALKYHQPNLPTIAGNVNPIIPTDNQLGLPSLEEMNKGITSSFLENLLDEFYTKVHPSLGQNSGKVCRVFNHAFTPRQSNSQNNWRDFFRYALGVGCLASEQELSSDFLAQHRSECRHLIRNDAGKLCCELHPIKTKYIRSLNKPKLLHWKLNGQKGLYKTVNMSHQVDSTLKCNSATTMQRRGKGIRPFYKFHCLQ